MATFKLLTNPDSQPKAVKGEKLGVMTFVLHLAPANLSGFEVCPQRTAGCTAGCLNTAGRGRFDNIQAARVRKTRRYFADRAGFLAELESEISKAIRFANNRGYQPAFRLNGTSDIPWHRIIDMPRLGAQFYDYTKVAKRATRETLPPNYSLTFSLCEDNAAEAQAVLAAGGNVAVVFRDKATRARYMGTGFMGAPVIDGDETDARFLDPRGCVVGLYAKGAAKRDTSGFVRD